MLEYIYCKKATSKDIKAKAKKEDHLEFITVFVVICYNYRKLIIYKVLNKVKKIITECYIIQIFR